MSWFKSLKTGSKLLLGFGVMAVLLGLVVITAYGTITAIRDSQQRLFERDFFGVAAMLELRSDQNRQQAQTLQMIHSSDRTRQEELVQEVQRRVGEIDESLRTLASVYADNPRFQQRLKALEDTLEAYRKTRELVFQHILAGRETEARAMLDAPQEARYEHTRALAIQLGDEMLQHSRAQIAASNQLVTRSLRMFAAIAVLALVMVLAMVTIFNRLIARPLVEVAGLAERIAGGDLTETLATDDRTDEVGLLHQAVVRMTDNFREQTRQLVEGANVLEASATRIVSSTSQLSASASESAAAVSETTTTVEEVRQTAQLATQKAEHVSDSAQKAAQIAQSGRKSTEDASAGMERIRRQMEAIGASMGRLSEQSRTIGQIIGMVDDLASQSNLLAVNAAIEAAKAGDHGKGFAVVAQEVKSLAEQSRQATSQVRTILDEIQKATTAAVLATEQGSKAVDAGTRQTELAGESIRALSAGVSEAAQAATQIAASSQQQLVGVDQVAVAMENIKEASTQNAESAQQLDIAARNLSALGQQIKRMVERYKL